MRDRARLWDALACAALVGMGFAAVYFYASGTSPIQPDNYQWDSALFQVVGKLWADGLTPYVDIFDHKGPLLFWIQRIAYAFSNPRTALYCIESLHVGAGLALAYGCMRLRLKPLTAFGGAALTGLFWLPLMEYGNLCETYCLPFLLLALLFQLRYLLSGRLDHPWGYALIYGLCFGANLMIRPNNGALIAAVTFGIALRLALRGRWRNLLPNALALLGGVLAVALPFVAYFAAKDALREFLYASWTYNLEYAKSLEFRLDWQNLRGVLYYITPSLLCIALGIAALCRKKRMLGGVLLLASAATLAVTISGVGYAHYFMLHVPLIALAFVLIPELAAHSGAWRAGLAAVCAAFVCLVCYADLPYAVQNVLAAPTAEEAAQEAEYDRLVAALQNEIPPEERDRVAVCGLLVTDAELFLKTDLHPVGRYCFLMEWHARADSSIKFRYLRSLYRGEAKWLIYREGGAGEDVMSVIEELFTLHAKHEYEGVTYSVYRWKE